MAIKNLQKVQHEYVLDSIFCTDYSEKSGEVDITNSLTTKGQLQYLASNFTSEALHDFNIRKFKGDKTSILADHLQGLPSWLSIPYTNYDILELGKKWEYDLSTEKKEDAFLENYWNLIANKAMQLMNKHDVEIKKYSLDELDFNEGMLKVPYSTEKIEDTLGWSLLKKVSIAEHDNGTYLYFDANLRSEIESSLTPLGQGDDALAKIVKQYEDRDFQGLNKDDLEFLGFEKARDLKFGNEYHIEYSPEIEERLKSIGFKKTFGSEGLADSFAVFTADNENHEDYKKMFLSVRENPTLAPFLVNEKGEEERPLRVHEVSQEEHYDTEDKRVNKKINKNR